MNLTGKRSYLWMVFFTVIVLTVQGLGQLLLQWIGGLLGFGEGALLALLAVAPFICVFLTAFLVMRLNSISWRESLWYLGFKKINTRQMMVGLLSLIPIAVSYAFCYLYYFQHGISVEPFENWPSLWFLILITAGFFEEVFFRGFVFQTLRKKSSFLIAAIVSSALWAFSHLANLLGGFDLEILLNVLATILISFFLGLAAVYVFEKGGNVLWGWSLTHVLFDSMGLSNIDHKGLFSLPRGLPALYQFTGIALCVIITFPLGRWLLPKDKKEEP